ncbi:MAG: XdhC family protein, partial [Alphaproteobacteria bacterium]|nr:XdhC family protein [Alphaproteobacteria bacterium]
MIAATPLAILQQALAWHEAGQPVVLVTLADFEGSTARGLGTQMAVTADGRTIGSFFAGCIEDAIIAEAGDTMAAGAGREVRYGAGSPYIDVRLPCGGGIVLIFTPLRDMDAAMLRGAVADLEARRPVTLSVSPEGIARGGEGFALHLRPILRIMCFGHGEDFIAFVRLARSFGAQVDAYSPHARDLVLLPDTHLLARLNDAPPCMGDD